MVCDELRGCVTPDVAARSMASTTVEWLVEQTVWRS